MRYSLLVQSGCLLLPLPLLLSQARSSRRSRQAVASLSALRACPVLHPDHPDFGTAALCLRSLLDDTLPRLVAAVGLPACTSAPYPNPEDVARSHAAAAATAGAATANPPTYTPLRTPSGAAAAATPGLPQRSACEASGDDVWVQSERVAQHCRLADSLVDPRYEELCCPGLRDACRALQDTDSVPAAASGTHTPQRAPSAALSLRPHMAALGARSIRGGSPADFYLPPCIPLRPI